MLTTELTLSERVLMSRRRAGLSVKELAPMLGVSESLLRTWETDAKREKARTQPPEPGDIKTTADLALYEQCVLARLRSGQKAKDVAKSISLSGSWLTKAERGELDDVEALANYWRVQAVLQ